jgi:glycosyltransferase involved in cell wall biosynthesis
MDRFPTILLFVPELPHYRAPVLAALDERLDGDLIVSYGRACDESEYMTVPGESLPFKHLTTQTRHVGMGRLYVQDVVSAFKAFGLPEVVIVKAEIRNLSLFPLLWFCKLKKIPIIVWGQGYSRNRDFAPNGNLYDRIHLSIIRLADAYVCYTANIRDTLTQYVGSDKLFVATNTLDTRRLLDIRQQLMLEGKEAVKRRLELDRKHYLSFIGRLQPRKKIPYLLEVYALLRQKHRLDVGLVIIGKGDQDPLKNQVAKLDVDDVHFLGALPDEKAGEYLFASDVMVMPGWLGLAVNHAFAFGLPVVSQRFGERLLGHGPEAAYVEHDMTGCFAEAGDMEAMAQAIIHILEHQVEFSTRVSRYMDRYLRVERMVEGFVDAIAYATCRLTQG